MPAPATTETLITAFHKPVTLQEQLDSIHEASPETAIGRIKIIAANKEGYGPDQVLLILEDARTREVRTNPQRRGVIQALNRAIKQHTKKPAKTEVIPAPKAVLADAKTALEKLRESIAAEEQVFLNSTLPQRLKMGLHCLKAHVIFTIKSDKRKGVGGRGKKTESRRDGVSGEGFEGWLATECPWLKKPTAYKYMTALKGLGLSESSTEADVEQAVQQNLRIGPVTIASLCAAAVEAIGPPPPPPETLQQSEFNFLRDGLKDFREQAEHLLALKTQLTGHPDMMRAAQARAYSILFELTGTNWRPSDEPDALALIDPDAITI
jgi:hypothetical protein